MPECNAEHHGYELLATIDGTDTKFSCNLAHGLYSWMGAASEGGYLGADAQSFFSAVVSGAAAGSGPRIKSSRTWLRWSCPRA